MLSGSTIKFITSLHHKKFREESGCFIAEGSKIVKELLESDFQIRGVYATAEWIITHLKEIQQKEIPAHETLPREMERISALNTPSPVLAVVEIPFSPARSGSISPDAGSNPTLTSKLTPTPTHPRSGIQHPASLILALDDIRDPGNLGTIIRIADWFGIDTVICSESSVEVYNPKVVQATMGSFARVTVYSCNLRTVLPQLTTNGFKVYGASLDGASIYTPGFIAGPAVVLIGSESHGISDELDPLITHRITIPSYCGLNTGRAESLNAAIAASIICSEFRRVLTSAGSQP